MRSDSLNIIFMGTPDFAVPCLNALIDNKYNVVGVVTQPDRPKGRGNNMTPPPVKELAIKHQIKVYQPERVKNPDFIATLKNISPDLIVVVAFGQILSKEILDIPRLGCINIHGSLLPKYRGAAPIQWAVINGEEVTGITSMYMDAGMDTGDMILKKEIIISEDETADVLFKRMSLLGAQTLIETIRLIEQDNCLRIPQDDTQASYAPMLNKDIGNINWTTSAKKIKDLVRGTNPWPGAYTFYKGSKIKIFVVDIIDNTTKLKPGTIVNVTKDSIHVQSGDGIVIIKEIQAENGKRMLVKDYLLGHTIDNNIILCGD